MGVLKICVLMLVLSGYYVTAQKNYKCDFETGVICPFLMNAKGNEENWKIGSGKLNEANTGPSVDHTTGTANGTYLFVNGSAARTNQVQLQTVAIKKDYCVRFFYHMYGADIGYLTVSTQSVMNTSDTRRFFYRTSTQGDRWKETFFTVTESDSMKLKGYRVIFTVNQRNASSVWGDIALDDVELTPGKCKDTKRDVTALCSFDVYDCGYSTRRIFSTDWKWQSQSSLTDFPSPPNTDHTVGTYIGGYWFFGEQGRIFGGFGSSESSILSSPVYEKPKTNPNCLQFFYYIDGDKTTLFKTVKEAYIRAFINYPRSKDDPTWLTTKAKNMTHHRQWTYAEVKVDISADFQFQFVAGIDSSAEAVLAIDDIKLVTGNCPEAGFCDFEENKCTWKDGLNLYNWVRNTGQSKTTIGPTSDNTLRTADGGYVVFSTKNKNSGSEANLESEFFPPNDKDMCLTFFYYMKGKDLGNLKVIRREENVTESTVWFLSDDQGDMWKKGMAVIKSSILHIQIVFKGTTGVGENGFMSLDDIRVRTGEKCKILPLEAHPRWEACVCKGGECVSENDDIVCRCPPGFGNFTNNSCKACNCGPDSSCFWRERLGDKICICKPGYQDKLGKCVDCECGPDSNCTLTSEGWLKPLKKVCHCQQGYYENDGKCVDFNSTLFPTTENSIPSTETMVVTTETSINKTTKIIDSCTVSPCQNGGICRPNGKSFVCYCKNPHFGKLCEKNIETC